MNFKFKSCLWDHNKSFYNNENYKPQIIHLINVIRSVQLFIEYNKKWRAVFNITTSVLISLSLRVSSKSCKASPLLPTTVKFLFVEIRDRGSVNESAGTGHVCVLRSVAGSSLDLHQLIFDLNYMSSLSYYV